MGKVALKTQREKRERRLVKKNFFIFFLVDRLFDKWISKITKKHGEIIEEEKLRLEEISHNPENIKNEEKFRIFEKTRNM